MFIMLVLYVVNLTNVVLFICENECQICIAYVAKLDLYLRVFLFCGTWESFAVLPLPAGRQFTLTTN